MSITQSVVVRSPQFIHSDTFSSQFRKRVKLDFASNLILGDNLSLEFSRNCGTVSHIDKVAATFSDINNFILANTTEQTIQNLTNNLIEFDDDYFMEYTINTDSNSEMWLDCYDNLEYGISGCSLTYSLLANTGGITITSEGGNYRNVNLEYDEDGTKYSIYVWEGANTSQPSTPIYSKNKQRIIDTQEKTYINFTPLVRAEFEYDINDYTLIGVLFSKIPPGVGKWSSVVTTNQLFGNDRDLPLTSEYYITDGWITPFEGQGLPDILLSGDRREYDINSIARIFFKTLNMTDFFVTINGLSIDYTASVFTDSAQSDEYLNSFGVNALISNAEDTLDIEIRYKDGGSEYSEFFYLRFFEECKFDLIDVYFKNKYGVIETINMTKLTKEILDIDKENYTRSVVDINGNHNISQHSKKDFNMNGRTKWVLNSKFFPEYMNDVYEELFLSEEVWINFEGNVVPVILLDKTFNYKTHLNDKLIQYTINVEASHQKNNNIM